MRLLLLIMMLCLLGGPVHALAEEVAIPETFRDDLRIILGAIPGDIVSTTGEYLPPSSRLRLAADKLAREELATYRLRVWLGDAHETITGSWPVINNIMADHGIVDADK